MQVFFPKMLHHFTIHQQYLRVWIFLHAFQYLIYLIRAIKICMKWYHTAILICITLMTKDVKHLFRCLLVTCMGLFWFVLRNVYSKFFLYFLPGQYVFLLLSCKSSLYILNASSLSNTWFANIFSYSMGCLFTVLMLLLAVQRYFLILISFNMSIFSFIACVFAV